MPRRLRCSDGDYVYHVLNRAVGRARLFRKAGDYLAFETILHEGCEKFGIGVMSYLVMPNHWHLVVRPNEGSVVRGAPYGDELWQQRTTLALGLQSSLRPRGRPRKAPRKHT
jgi:hypothetical protein